MLRNRLQDVVINKFKPVVIAVQHEHRVLLLGKHMSDVNAPRPQFHQPSNDHFMKMASKGNHRLLGLRVISRPIGI